MKKIKKISIGNGLYWVEVPEANLRMQCGVPAESVKLLKKNKLIQHEDIPGFFSETGPNTILLSDVLIQNGEFSNLSEFSILQMFYRQGRLIPGHPNNRADKPLVIGDPKQVERQKNYLYRGNYGLDSKDEISKCGIPTDITDEMMQLKLKFAFGEIVEADKLVETIKLIDTVKLGPDKVEIKNGVFIKRLSLNVFEVEYEEESVTIDLNLKTGEKYQLPYKLNDHATPMHHFTIINSGEGDGWNVDLPCMASVIIYKGKVYIIDAGPSLISNLKALGISLFDIEGIFHTHAHDDHFASLMQLMRSDRKIKYFATPLVTSSVFKKAAGLLNVNEQRIYDWFDVQELTFDEWHSIDGLEVKPLFSPHPVETNIFYFRSLIDGEYKSYAHLADIISLENLESMVRKSESETGISESFFEKIKNDYLQFANYKKIDAGGGLIHGVTSDFTNDPSEKIGISHISREVTHEESKIGTQEKFGSLEILIEGDQQKHAREKAKSLLIEHLTELSSDDFDLLTCDNFQTFKPGTIFVEEGEKPDFIYLTLSGITKKKTSANNEITELYSGALIGEASVIEDAASLFSFETVSYVNALKIPSKKYLEIVKKYKLTESLLKRNKFHTSMQNLIFSSYSISSAILDRLFNSATIRNLKENSLFVDDDYNMLSVVSNGKVELIGYSPSPESIGNGGIIWPNQTLDQTLSQIKVIAKEDTELIQIQENLLYSIPLINWEFEFNP